MRLSCQTEWLSAALPAFLQSLRYVSAYAVTQLPFICPRYRLTPAASLVVAFIAFVFLPSLVCSSEVYTDVHQWVCECPSFPYFLLFFSGLHFVTCGSPFFSLHSTLFVVASVLRMISFAVRFPVLGTFLFVLRSFPCFNLCLFWPAVHLRPLLTRVPMLLAVVSYFSPLTGGFVLSRLSAVEFLPSFVVSIRRSRFRCFEF